MSFGSRWRSGRGFRLPAPGGNLAGSARIDRTDHLPEAAPPKRALKANHSGLLTETGIDVYGWIREPIRRLLP
jgi:hypothetical protein